MSIIDNRKAFHDYFIEEKLEAGIVLEGWEVKGIRAGRANIKEAYVLVRNGEVFLLGMHISHFSPSPPMSPPIRRARASFCCMHARSENWSARSNVPAIRWCRLICIIRRGASSSRSDWPRARNSSTSVKRQNSRTGNAKKRA